MIRVVHVLSAFFILFSGYFYEVSAQSLLDEGQKICNAKSCIAENSQKDSLSEAPLEASLINETQNFFTSLFDTSMWPARWYCGEWTEFHGWFYILSDVGIWAAYFAIPFILGLFLYKKKNTGLPFPGIFLLFILFILACGLTHLIDAVIFWIPIYKFSALIRFVTATVSIMTVFALVKVTPKVMEYKSPEELERIIHERTMELEAANEELASMNEELYANNEQLKNEMFHREVAQAESKLLFESIPQLAWTTDDKGNITYLNQVFKEATGIEELNNNEQLWSELINPDDAEKSKKTWMKSLQTGENYEVQERIKYKDGDYRWILTRAIPIKDNNDTIIKWIGTCTDIHEQKISEQRKDTFLNIASHELKTPLTIISAYTEMALYRENIVKDEIQNKYLNKINTQVSKLDKLINELLDVSRIDTGKMEYEFSKENFDDVIYEGVDDFQQVKNTNHTISVEGKTDKLINCDRGKLNQVLFNLLSNSIKYSEGNTEIKVSLFHDKNCVYCKVTDQGEGIPSNEINKIFTRFYRTSKIPKAGGLGLGLYISEEIVKRHNGKISVKSKVGEGSSFTIALPINS